MGKLLKQQRRGKGSVAYAAPSHRYKEELTYLKFEGVERNGSLRGQVISFTDDPARGALLMEVLFENGMRHMFLAPEGIAIGDEVYSGSEAKIGLGSVLPLARIPEGAPIYNIEMTGSPKDSGFKTKEIFIEECNKYATVNQKSLTKDSDYLICSSYEDNSTKVQKANKLKVPIITYEDFIKQIK